MGKVWLVTSGEYDDYAVQGIFTTREKAEEFRDWYNYPSIEEEDLDPPVPDNDGLKVYFLIAVCGEGTGLIRCQRRSNETKAPTELTFDPRYNKLTMLIKARDSEEATAIFTAKREDFLNGNCTAIHTASRPVHQYGLTFVPCTDVYKWDHDNGPVLVSSDFEANFKAAMTERDDRARKYMESRISEKHINVILKGKE
jgi:hypothetical protein